MKTFVVLGGNDKTFIVNAESAVEAVQYAIAKGFVVQPTYLVYDHDLNLEEVTVEPKANGVAV